MKGYRQGLVVLGMMVDLSGCHDGAEESSEREKQNQPVEQQQSESQPVTLQSSEGMQEEAVAREIMYHYHNGIKTYDKELIDSRPEVNGIKCVQISGLRDEQVEQKINNRLEQAVIELATRELPPYRGIKRKTADILPEDLTQCVNMFVFYDESNLFSVRLERRISYEYVFGTAELEGLTFDLNTGEELMLSDLFADGYDYQSAIVEYIRDGVAGGWLRHAGGEHFEVYSDLFTLLKPFDTVKKSQKFYLSAHDTIALILDYDTPEFDVEGYAQVLRIEAERMADKGSSMIFFEKYETGDDRLYKTEDENFRRVDIDRGTHFILVSAEVTNNNFETEEFMPSRMGYEDSIYTEIIYSDGYEYTSIERQNEERFQGVEIEPMASLRGEIAYEVADVVVESDEPMLLRFRKGSESVVYRLR